MSCGRFDVASVAELGLSPVHQVIEHVDKVRTVALVCRNCRSRQLIVIRLISASTRKPRLQLWLAASQLSLREITSLDFNPCRQPQTPAHARLYSVFARTPPTKEAHARGLSRRHTCQTRLTPPRPQTPALLPDTSLASDAGTPARHVSGLRGLRRRHSCQTHLSLRENTSLDGLRRRHTCQLFAEQCKTLPNCTLVFGGRRSTVPSTSFATGNTS